MSREGVLKQNRESINLTILKFDFRQSLKKYHKENKDMSHMEKIIYAIFNPNSILI